jgi:hypothetical protein
MYAAPKRISLTLKTPDVEKTTSRIYIMAAVINDQLILICFFTFIGCIDK